MQQLQFTGFNKPYSTALYRRWTGWQAVQGGMTCSFITQRAAAAAAAAAVVQYVCPADGQSPCRAGNAWPYGMCTLKKIANPEKPEFWSTNPSEWLGTRPLSRRLSQ